MVHGLERRVLGAAAAVAVAGLSALPFAGALRPLHTELATGPGEVSTAPAPTSTTAATVPTTTVPPAPVAEVHDADVGGIIEAPPIVVVDASAPVGLPMPEPAEPGGEAVAASIPAADPATGNPAAPPPDHLAELLALLAPNRTTPPPSSSPAPPPEPLLPPPPPPAPDPTAPAVPPEPDRIWAVVIGIDDYPGRRHDLLAARADAETVMNALLGYGVPQDQIRSVLDWQGSVQGILQAAWWLAANAGPDDTAIFFYAGHARDLGNGTEVVVGADGGWVADWYLAELLAPMAAQEAWMVVAACFGGGFDELATPGRILTAAAPPGALAYENDEIGRSYLVEYVFQKGMVLGGIPEPTVQAAVGWAMNQLAADFPQYQLWNVDRSDRPMSLDGARRV